MEKKQVPEGMLCIKCLSEKDREREATHFITLYGEEMPVCDKCLKKVKEEEEFNNTMS